MRIKHFLAAFAVLAFAVSSYAQRLDNPVTFPVTFYGWGVGTHGGSFAFGFAPSAVAQASATGSGVGFYSNPVTALVVPGKDYILQVSSNNLGAVVAYFQPDPSYEIYINGYRSTGAAGPGNFTFRFRIEATQDLSASVSKLRGGEASSFPEDKAIWYMSLGSTSNGRSAGVVGFRAATLDGVTRLHTSEALMCDPLDPSEVDVQRDGNGHITRIEAPEVIVEVDPYDPNGTSYDIRVYSIANQTTPFITYTIRKMTVTGGSGIQIDKLEDGVSWSTALQQVGSVWTHYGWRVTSDTSNHTFDTTKKVVTTISGNTATVDYGDGLQLKQKTYAAYTWPDSTVSYELANVTLGGPGLTSAPVTTHEYYATSTGTGWARAVKSTIEPSGKWVKYDYFNGATDTRGGLVQRAYRPWLDEVATPGAASLTNCHVETFDYAANYDGRLTALASRVVTIKGTQVGKTTWTYNFNFTSANSRTLSRKEQRDYVSSSGYLTTVNLAYLPTDPDPYFRGRAHSVTHPNETKEAFAYYRGTWNPTTKTFTSSSSGSDRLVLSFHGQTTAGTQAPTGTLLESWTQGSTEWELDPIFMVPGRSTVTESVVDSKGRSVFVAENVYTSTGTIERISGALFTYDDHGRLVEELDIVRTVGTNTVCTSRTYEGSLLLTETSPEGVVTRYGYDDFLRPELKIVGDGVLVDYPQRVQKMIFDSANRVAEVSPFEGGSPITIEYDYDTAGRLTEKREVSPNGGHLVTSFSYPTTRSSNTQLPTGAILSEAVYMDGRKKSLGGSGRAPVEFSYEVNSTGLKVIRQNGSTKANGWTEEQFDYLGRVTKRSSPAPGWTTANDNILDTVNSYDPSAGHLIKQATTYRADNNVALTPDKLFVYDAGRLVQEGLDIDEDGSLVTESNDRITAYETSLSKDTWGWRRITRTSVYATAGESTVTEASRVETRLTGFNNGSVADAGIVIGDVVNYDANGRATATWSYVDPAEKTARTDVTIQGNSVSGFSTSVNGYPAEAKAVASGARTRSTYDSLGRLSKSGGRWDGTNYTATDNFYYYGNTGFVSSQIIGGVTASYAYAWGTSGRTVTTTDAVSSSYIRYNAMDLPFHVGGAGASPMEYGYDSLGRRTSLTTWRGGPYTEDNWPAITAGDTTTWAIEPATGLVSSKIFANDDHVDFTYTPLGQVLTRNWARGVTTTYAYYDGSTTTVTDPTHRTQELRGVTYSDATPAVSYSYTRMGLVETVNDATGSRDFVYDEAQPLRLASEAYDDFYGTRVLSQQYDSVYRPVGFKLGTISNFSADLTQTLVYGATGLPDHIDTQIGATAARSFTYTYHPHTNLVAGYSTGSYAVSYDYQPSSARRTVIDSKWSGASVTRFDLQHDSRGLIQSAIQSGSAFSDYYQGTSYDSVFNRYVYNDRGELHSAAMYRDDPPLSGELPPSGSELPGRRFEYRYDSFGNRTSVGATGTASGGDEEYTLRENGLNQYETKENNTVRVLGTTAAGANVAASGATVTKRDRSFGADVFPQNTGGPAKGSVTVYAAILEAGPNDADLLGSVTRSYLVPSRVQPFGYDADGNLTSDGLWVYGYDAENRLVQMTSALPTGLGFARLRLDFKYDYLGRRVEKSVFNLDTNQTMQARRYLYQGWNLVAEFAVINAGTSSASCGSLSRSYTWGLDLAGSLGTESGAGALLQIHTAGQSYFPAYDGSGNVAALVKSDGSLAAIYEYSPFGETLRAEVLDSTVVDQPFRFSTKFTDNESGLTYYGYRYYSAAYGRFINRDPIEESGGANLYAFVGNNGINRWDVLGMGPESVDTNPLAPLSPPLTGPDMSSKPSILDPIIVTARKPYEGVVLPWNKRDGSAIFWPDMFYDPVGSDWISRTLHLTWRAAERWTSGTFERPIPYQANRPKIGSPAADTGYTVTVTKDGQIVSIAPNSGLKDPSWYHYTGVFAANLALGLFVGDNAQDVGRQIAIEKLIDAWGLKHTPILQRVIAGSNAAASTGQMAIVAGGGMNQMQGRTVVSSPPPGADPRVFYTRVQYGPEFARELLEYHRLPSGGVMDPSGRMFKAETYGSYWEIGHAGAPYSQRVLDAARQNMSFADWFRAETDLRLLRPELIYTNRSNQYQDAPTPSGTGTR